jgi:3-oxosteroid 1-dehydrogenase
LDSDVIVIGSGAAGLASAVSAATAGAQVIVLESSEAIGGTSCFSGGGMWIPNNRFMAEEGIPDSREDVIGYIKSVVTHVGLEDLIETYVDQCNTMIDFFEANTKIVFQKALGHPDYRPDLPGSREHGRCVSQPLFDTNLLGEYKPLLRKGWFLDASTADETYQMHLTGRMHFDLPHLMAQRREAGLVGNGMALVGYLLEGALSAGATVRVNSRAVELTRGSDGQVCGVVVEGPEGREELRASHGVILACGGFEWDAQLVDRFLAAPMVAPASPGHNRGDGLKMAMKVGAGLANMTEAWWNMLYMVPGDEYEGRQLARPTSDIRGKPGMIIVNRAGHRFVNESLNYHDLGKAMRIFDPDLYEYPNDKAFLIIDAKCRSTYRIHSIGPDDPDPEWMLKADTLDELAELAGVDGEALEEQVATFNRHAAKGVDPVFRRGENAYDRHMGDALIEGPAMCLRPLEGPYYAVTAYMGCFGTRGGPMTGSNAQVLDPDGSPIAGLYAVGNTAAHVFGDAYPGGGSTLGPALTFGYLAGQAIMGADISAVARHHA